MLRLALVSLALALVACATSGRPATSAAPRVPAVTPAVHHYTLCTDPQFDCVAPELQPVRVDTNLVGASPAPHVG